MIEIKNKKDCTGCYSCQSICQKNCIEMQYDKGFWYPFVNKTDCVNCNLCEKVCPIINFSDLESYDVNAYAAYNKDESIRNNSSSGGIFSSFSGYILKNGGIVFGAAYDDRFNVKHIGINDESDINKLRGSKYVQSRIGNIYKEVKTNLDNDRLVYFSGTACQVDGLKCYLGKEYNNLICQDLICHGVPSPIVWEKYINNFGDIKNVNFRNKSNGWKNFSLCITDTNENIKYINDVRSDSYLLGFLRNIYLRPSCYDCKYKTIERKADITLADFWGIENEIPDMFDDKGTSFVIVHSKKGQELFDCIKDRIIFKEIDVETGAKYQSTLKKSAYKNPDYDKFFRNLDKMSFETLYKKYFSDRFFLRLKRSIARKLNK